MSKIKYSKCLTDLYRLYNSIDKKEIKELEKSTNVDFNTCKQFVFNNNLVKLIEYNGCSEQVLKDTVKSIGRMFFSDLNGLSTHVFIDSENLFRFLENMNVRDIEGVKKYILENISDCGVIEYDGNNIILENISDCGVIEYDGNNIINDEVKTLDISLHLPNVDFGYTFSILIEKDGTLGLYYMKDIHFAYINSEHSFLKKQTNDIDVMDLKVWNLMLNTIMYMSCFPERVKNGLPKGFTIGSSFNTKKVIISADIIVDEFVKVSKEGVIVTPHFRKAHFRYCGSDYFKGKRGEFIFVKGSMVNSKNVKTIVEGELS